MRWAALVLVLLAIQAAQASPEAPPTLESQADEYSMYQVAAYEPERRSVELYPQDRYLPWSIRAQVLDTSCNGLYDEDEAEERANAITHALRWIQLFLHDYAEVFPEHGKHLKKLTIKTYVEPWNKTNTPDLIIDPCPGELLGGGLAHVGRRPALIELGRMSTGRALSSTTIHEMVHILGVYGHFPSQADHWLEACTAYFISRIWLGGGERAAALPDGYLCGTRLLLPFRVLRGDTVRVALVSGRMFRVSEGLYLVRLGSIVSVSPLNETIPVTEHERLRFREIDVDVGFSSYRKSPIKRGGGEVRIVAVSDTLIRPRWVTEYWVEVASDYPVGLRSGWYPSGSLLRVPEDLLVVGLGPDERLRLKGFMDQAGRLHSPEAVRVDGPLRLRAVWAREVLVSVEGPGDYVGGGWVEVGSATTVAPREDVIDLGNGSRLVFKGFKGYGPGPAALTPERPLALEAEWELQHRVVIRSRFIGGWEGWVADGRALDPGLPARLELPNGTMAVLRGFFAGGSLLQPPITVDRPLNLTALWDVYHLLRVVSRFPVEVNGTPVSGEYAAWLPEGSSITVEPVDPYVGDGVRARFRGWEPGARPGLSLRIQGPATLKALWDAEYRVWFRVIDGSGRLLEGVRILLAGAGVREAAPGEALWLPEGGWRARAFLEQYQVADQNITIASPGEVALRADVIEARVVVRDLVGLPAPLALVRGPTTWSVTGHEGSTTLWPTPPGAPIMAIQIGFDIKQAGDEIELRTIASPYLLATLAAALATIKKLNRRKAQKHGGKTSEDTAKT